MLLSLLPLQLKNGPLHDYQQITSLLKDRPTHKGMDFKTPVGTEVVAPFAGTVVRSNWNFGNNGNCIEVQYEDGVLAKFLHLNENKVKPGDNPDERVVYTAGGGEVTVVDVQGEVDVYTAPTLDAELVGLIDAGREQFVVDLSGVDFIDSTGLSVLVKALTTLGGRGGISVVVTSERVAKVFRLTGMDASLPLYGSLDDALAT